MATELDTQRLHSAKLHGEGPIREDSYHHADSKWDDKENRATPTILNKIAKQSVRRTTSNTRHGEKEPTFFRRTGLWKTLPIDAPNNTCHTVMPVGMSQPPSCEKGMSQAETVISKSLMLKARQEVARQESTKESEGGSALQLKTAIVDATRAGVRLTAARDDDDDDDDDDVSAPS